MRFGIAWLVASRPEAVGSAMSAVHLTPASGIRTLRREGSRGGKMRALLYGVKPDPQPEPQEDNQLLRNLAHTPMRLVDMDDPPFLLPDWVVTKPRLTGICGSDSKQVFMDFGNEVGNPDNPMKGFFSLPQVLGHEVVAEVVAL